MYRFFPYLLLFAACMLLQIFLFDNLALGVYVDPLVYVAFLLLLPLDAAPVILLGAGLATGVAMDCAMGAAGINTIASLLVAFARPYVVGVLYGRENAHEGGTPSPVRMGARIYWHYLIVLVLLHHAVFFLLESLSWLHVVHTLVRTVVSTLLTLAAVWFIGRLFTAKLPVRV